MSEKVGAELYRTTEVGFRYGAQWVLRGITMTVKRGEILGIIGPNGAGKTSLLKILGRLLQTHEGEAQFQGGDLRSINTKELAQKVAIVPQEYQITFPYTSLEVVLMGRYPHLRGWAFETKEDYHIVRLAMERMNVEQFSSRLFTELSGGEKQRVIIARALAQQPHVLLLDEPATFLDLNHQMGIFAILQELNHNMGLTIVLVSHDLNMASQCCHRLLLLNKGKMVQLGSPKDVLTEQQIQETYRCAVLVDTHPITGTPRVTPLQRVNHNA